MTRDASDDARDWDVVARWRAFDGESRANALRAVAVLLFYGVELLNRYGLHVGGLSLAPVPGVDARLHGAITALAVTWAACAAGVVVLLRNRIFPRALPYLTTAVDVVLLTAMLSVADGPVSPLVVVYFPVLALATLRANVRLVRFATCLVAGGYLLLVLESAFYRHELRVPFYQALLFVLASVMLGAVLSRVASAQPSDAKDFAERRSLSPSRPPSSSPSSEGPPPLVKGEAGEGEGQSA